MTFLLAAGVAWPAPAVPPLKPTDAQVSETCSRIGRKLHSVQGQKCAAMGFHVAGDGSVNGTPILVKEYPPAKGRPPQARILVIGGIHGDEYSSVSIVFRWLEMLDKHHTGLFHWRLAPLVNPDGLLQAQSQRVNAHGVDLNRNFFTPEWERESVFYWEKQTGKDPRRFPGAKAMSEPETRWIAHEIDTFRPHAIISVHAPYSLVDFDGPQATPPKRLGPLVLSLLGTFPGSLGRYAGLGKNIPVITIELANAATLPPEGEVRKIWDDMVQWLRLNVHDTPRPQRAQQPAAPQEAALRDHKH